LLGRTPRAKGMRTGWAYAYLKNIKYRNLLSLHSSKVIIVLTAFNLPIVFLIKCLKIQNTFNTFKPYLNPNQNPIKIKKTWTIMMQTLLA
jgi:hypothetical protein